MEQIPAVSILMNYLKSARKAVPAVRYAIGLIGVAAAGTIISTIAGQGKAAILLTGMVFVGMILLYVFSIATRSDNISIKKASAFLIWIVVASFSASLVLILSAISFGEPSGMRDFILSEKPSDRTKLFSVIFSSNDPNESISAIDKLTKIAIKEKRVDDEVISILKKVIDNTDWKYRSVHAKAIESLKVLLNNDFSHNIGDELESGDFAESDFSGTNLSNLSMRNAFLVNSNFRNANLTNVDLEGADLRGALLNGAIVNHANLRKVDWFNASGLSQEQIISTISNIEKCPGDGKDFLDSFIKYHDSRYGIRYDHFTEQYQMKMRNIWQRYVSHGGLCEFVRLHK